MLWQDHKCCDKITNVLTRSQMLWQDNKCCDKIWKVGLGNPIKTSNNLLCRSLLKNFWASFFLYHFYGIFSLLALRYLGAAIRAMDWSTSKWIQLSLLSFIFTSMTSIYAPTQVWCISKNELSDFCLHFLNPRWETCCSFVSFSLWHKGPLHFWQ